MLKEMILNQGVCREYFIGTVGLKQMALFDQVYQHFKQSGKLKEHVDARLFTMSLMSLTLHPWYMRDLVGKMDGVVYDEQFLENLIKLNTQLIQHGCFKGEPHDS